MGIEIDWSKAPEGSTHFDPEDKNFLRVIGHALLVYNASKGWKVPFENQYGFTIEDCEQSLIKRPEWTGEGLPPVGTVCEVREVRVSPANAFENWSKCTIIAHNTGSGGDPQICATDDRGDFAIFYPATDGTEFRPIRTPEQIAAEEREFAIIEIERVAMSGGSVKTMAEALYDAGYRKQVQP